MSISKKIRFEVFKRDHFRCCYCGSVPPRVILEVDHIDPKSEGGGDDINNLITACFDCNRGKRDIPLNKIPPQLGENLEVLQEKEEQIKEYRKFIKRIENRIKRDIEEVSDVYANNYPGWILSDQFKHVSIKRFLAQLPKHVVIDAFRNAMSICGKDRDGAIKYFCGTCWGKIRDLQQP